MLINLPSRSVSILAGVTGLTALACTCAGLTLPLPNLFGGGGEAPIETDPDMILGDPNDVPIPEEVDYLGGAAVSNNDIASNFDNSEEVRSRLDDLGREMGYYFQWWDQYCDQIDEVSEMYVGVIAFRDAQAVADVEQYLNVDLGLSDPNLVDHQDDVGIGTESYIEYFEFGSDCDRQERGVVVTWRRANMQGHSEVIGFSNHDTLETYALDMARYVDELLAAEQSR